jgi:hypothetical protein
MRAQLLIMGLLWFVVLLHLSVQINTKVDNVLTEVRQLKGCK